MVELELLVIPFFLNETKCWTRYVVDNLCYTKTDSWEYVLNMLNDFHRNIQFIYEVETDPKYSVVDVLLTHDSPNNNINTIVNQKSKNNYIYLNWESFVPDQWVLRTLRTLTKWIMIFVLPRKCCRKSWTILKKYFLSTITILFG